MPLFNDLVPAELERIEAGTRRVECARGEVLFRRGDASEGFYTVIFGQVKLAFTSPSGAEKVVEVMGPGQSFGEAVMFLEKPYPVFAQALSDSVLLHISRSVVFAEIERDPRFARRIISGLSRRLHSLVIDLETYTLRSGTQRLIGYLLRGVPEGAAAGPVEVALTISKTVLASRLSLTPEHLSRILHDLTEDQLVSVEGRSIRILDVEALRRYGD
ncbi:MAG: Crp/Fnr family transcriptional regulator [Burkholderiales bacterium]|nr:Crp/Fnr family transcriptional regulator [Burkholderiales bacterium]